MMNVHRDNVNLKDELYNTAYKTTKEYKQELFQLSWKQRYGDHYDYAIMRMR